MLFFFLLFKIRFFVFFACLVAPWPVPEAEEEAEEEEAQAEQAEEWVARASSWSNAITVDRVNVVI